MQMNPKVSCTEPLRNPTLGVIVAKEGNVLGRRSQGVRAEGCMALRLLILVAVSQTIPSVTIPSYVCLSPSCGSAGGNYNSPLHVELTRTTRNPQEKSGEKMERKSVIEDVQLTALFAGGATWKQKGLHTFLVCAWL
jgi:hypothetical protein